MTKISPAESNKIMSNEQIESAGAAVSQEETVKFNEDRGMVEQFPDEFIQIDSRLLQPLKSDVSTDIKRFLSRPVIVSEFDWATTDTVGTSLYSENVVKNWLHSSGSNNISMWKDKIAGFSVLRCKIVYRIQINAMRFQQGRLLFNYFPQADLNPFRYQMVNQSLMYQTQLPRVEIDCSVNSSVIMEIPYVSPTIGYQIGTGAYGHGQTNLIVYSPLVDPSGSGKVGVTIWAHLEDIELMFPAMPQSGKKTIRKKARGGASVGDTLQEEELDNATGGSMSSFFNSVADTADKAGKIPLLSSVAAPVKWASNIAGNVAAAFGFSNPSLSDASQQIIQKTAAASQNVNGIDTSQKLGLFQDNNVQVLPGAFGTDVDEMDLNYVCSRPSYYFTFPWNGTHSIGHLVGGALITPTYFWNSRTIPTSGIQVRDVVPMYYVASMFKYWRGSITCTFKFVKTEFHSGRLLFAFQPQFDSLPSFSSTNYNLREVVDIRESNEFTITIPYVSNTQYLGVDNLDFCGTLNFYVLNELQAPSTVSPNIQIIMEVSAGPDFELAVPTGNPAYLPINASNTALTGSLSSITSLPSSMTSLVSTAPSSAQQTGTVVAQVLGTDVVQNLQNATTEITPPNAFSQSTLGSGDLAASVFCIGEKVTSLRQLVKRASWFKNLPALPTTSVGVPNGLTAQPLANPSGYVALEFYMDPINWLSAMYQYRRGGMRYKTILSDVSSSTKSSICAIIDTDFNQDAGSHNTYPYNFQNTGPSIDYVPQRGISEVEIPMYSQTPIQVNYNTLFSANPSGPVYDTKGIWWFIPGSWPRSSTFRQASDDFEMGFFIGVLPMVARATFPNPSQGP